MHVVLYMLYSLSSLFVVYFFFFKQKTAYEMRISDWSSDVCSSDLAAHQPHADHEQRREQEEEEGGRRDHRQKVAPRNHDHGAQERGHSANSPMASARASASNPASTWRTIWTQASWSAGRAIDRPRSDERGVGKECGSAGGTRGSPYH